MTRIFHETDTSISNLSAELFSIEENKQKLSFKDKNEEEPLFILL